MPRRDDWIDWPGKKLPKRHHAKLVVVRWRNGRESREYTAGGLRWEWGDNPDDWDIVSYRKVVVDGE